MKKFSIIVPVYNVERYIQNTIDSILNQSYSNFELIIIDDGSTDKSGEICDRYKDDVRVNIIHQQNLGVSSARNKGLEIATGEYIVFVDGDDYLEPSALISIASHINGKDMLVYGFYEKYVKKSYQKTMNMEMKIIDNVEAIRNVVNNCYGGYIFNKVFKRNIIVKNNLTFNKNIHMCEDLIFVIEFLQYAKSVKVIPDILYSYRMRKSSAVWQKNDKYLTVFDAYEIVRQILKQNKIAEDNLNYKLAFSYSLINHKQKKVVNDKHNYNFKNLLKTIYKSSDINCGLKIKLIILCNFKFLYYLYIIMKVNVGMRYE